MARRSIRTKGGRLKTAERRRRIRSAGAKPGEVVLLDVTRKRERGQRTRNAILVDFVVETQWSVDLDIRKFLHEVRINLAEHYRNALLSGMRADGKGPLPPLKRDREGRTRGVKSGEMAEKWGIGPVVGGPFRASVKLRPFDGGEHAPMISRELRRGVDYQSVEGDAAKVIQDTLQDWIRRAVPASGDGVATPESVPAEKSGTLPDFKT